MTHDGQSAARVSGACFAMGEAAGTAAAAVSARAAAPLAPLRIGVLAGDVAAEGGDELVAVRAGAIGAVAVFAHPGAAARVSAR